MKNACCMHLPSHQWVTAQSRTIAKYSARGCHVMQVLIPEIVLVKCIKTIGKLIIWDLEVSLYS